MSLLLVESHAGANYALVLLAVFFLTVCVAAAAGGLRRGGGGAASSSQRGLFGGKVVWVTGASSGLGEQLALQAAASPCEKLILSGRRASALETVADACVLASGGAMKRDAVTVLPFDLGDRTCLAGAVSRALEVADRIDILVNNGGVSHRGNALGTTLDVDEALMNVNYFGAVALAKGVLPGMRERSAGHIVVVNSVQGKLGVANRTAYAASKHALAGFFDCLRAELDAEGSGVSVSCIYPGYIRTNLSLNALTGDGAKHGVMDATTESGLDAVEAAQQVWQAVAQGRPEFVMAPLKVKLACVLRALAPSTLFHMVAKREKRSMGHKSD